MQMNLILQRIYQCVTDLKATMDQHYQSSPSNQLKKEKTKPNQNSSPYITLKKEEKVTQKNSHMDQAESQKKLISKQIKKLTKKIEPQMTEQQKQEIRKKLLKQRPKPPMNPFISYVKAQKDRIKNKSSVNLSIAQITAEASLEWKKLAEEQKEPYVKQYERSHVQYSAKRDKFLKQNPILKKIKMKKLKKKQKESKPLSQAELKQKNMKQELYDQHLKIIRSNQDQQSSVSDSESSVSSSSNSSSSVSDSEQDESSHNIEQNLKEQNLLNSSKPKINININSNKTSNSGLSLTNKNQQKETRMEKNQREYHSEINKRERPTYEKDTLEMDLNNVNQGYKRKIQSESIRSEHPKMIHSYEPYKQNKIQKQQQKQQQIKPKPMRQDMDRQKQFEKQKMMMQEPKQRSKEKEEQKIKSEAKQKMLNMLSKKIDTPKIQSNFIVKNQQNESDSLNI